MGKFFSALQKIKTSPPSEKAEETNPRTEENISEDKADARILEKPSTQSLMPGHTAPIEPVRSTAANKNTIESGTEAEAPAAPTQHETHFASQAGQAEQVRPSTIPVPQSQTRKTVNSVKPRASSPPHRDTASLEDQDISNQPDEHPMNTHSVMEDEQQERDQRTSPKNTIDKKAISENLLVLRKQTGRHSFKKLDSNPKRFRKKRKNHLITTVNPESIVTESFRVIRTMLFNSLEGKNIKTILITSSLPLEGKSFIAGNLAVSIARGLDQYVLLVDADLRRPSLSKLFGIDADAGLSDFLTDATYELNALIKKTETPKLSLLPAGSAYEKSSELLSSELMKAFVQEVKYRYDDRYVIFDSPPAHISETLALADVVDGVIFVVNAGKTEKKIIERAVDLVGKQRIIGVILNRAESAMKQYYYYY